MHYMYMSVTNHFDMKFMILFHYYIAKEGAKHLIKLIVLKSLRIQRLPLGLTAA